MDKVEQFRSGRVVVGVDTHKHIHVAAVMDSIGGILAGPDDLDGGGWLPATPGMGGQLWQDHCYLGLKALVRTGPHSPLSPAETGTKSSRSRGLIAGCVD